MHTLVRGTDDTFSLVGIDHKRRSPRPFNTTYKNPVLCQDITTQLTSTTTLIYVVRGGMMGGKCESCVLRVVYKLSTTKSLGKG